MPLAVESDSVATQVGEWSTAPILLIIGLLLLASGRRAGRQTPAAGRAKRGWGIGLTLVAVLTFAGRITAEVREATEDELKARTPFASQSASAIAEVALKQMVNGVTSLKLEGRGQVNGDQSSFQTTFDVDGRCRTQLKQGDATQTFIFDGKIAHVKANRAGWRSLTGTDELAQDAIDLIGSKWATFSLNDLTEGMEKSTRPDRYCAFEDLFAAMRGAGSTDIAVGETVMINGVEAIELSGEDPRVSGSFWVEIAEPHHVLRLVLTQRDLTADISMSNFNKPFASFKPAKRNTIDLR